MAVVAVVVVVGSEAEAAATDRIKDFERKRDGKGAGSQRGLARASLVAGSLPCFFVGRKIMKRLFPRALAASGMAISLEGVG